MDTNKTTILEARVRFLDQPFLKPLHLSAGVITDIVEARVSVRVRVGNREAEGAGSIYLSDLWAWPASGPSRAEKVEAMKRLCQRLAATLPEATGGEPCHPLELGLRLHHAMVRDGDEAMPILARSVCASPFDAAVHDAAGQALGCSAFQFYDEGARLPSADRCFAGVSAAEAIGRLLREPRRELEAWYLLGAQDDPVEMLSEPVRQRGYRCFKLKVTGSDPERDALRTAATYRAARDLGVASPRLSLDSNEGNPDVESVVAYLDVLQRVDAEAYAALEYLEQPTARDIERHPVDWSALRGRKPILLDEGLTSLELLPTAKEQGWGGLALKTCKGHSFALVAAAWMAQQGGVIALQDLTNPGYSAIHAFLFAAHVPTLNGIELNSPQYTPAANRPWLPALSALFEPTGGVHRLDEVQACGLGSRLVPMAPDFV